MLLILYKYNNIVIFEFCDYLRIINNFKCSFNVLNSTLIQSFLFIIYSCLSKPYIVSYFNLFSNSNFFKIEEFLK